MPFPDQTGTLEVWEAYYYAGEYTLLWTLLHNYGSAGPMDLHVKNNNNERTVTVENHTVSDGGALILSHDHKESKVYSMAVLSLCHLRTNVFTRSRSTKTGPWILSVHRSLARISSVTDTGRQTLQACGCANS